MQTRWNGKAGSRMAASYFLLHFYDVGSRKMWDKKLMCMFGKKFKYSSSLR